MQKILAWYPELRTLPPGVFAVGGVVRDALLGIEPLDADLTGQSVREIARSFGSRHATHVIELGRDPMQVLRVVVAGRIYDFVEMTGQSIEEDLLRRDFTMNTLALDLGTGGLRDPLDGASDILKRLVRMVSEENLRDDPLRIVKAVRMAVKFDFRIEAATLEAMRRNAGMISNVAVERVTYELRAILSANAPRGIALLSASGLDRIIFERELTSEDVKRLETAASSDPDLGLAILLADRDQPQILALGRRWKLSSASLQLILAMHRLAEELRSNPGSIRVALYDYGRAVSERGVAYLRGIGELELSESLQRTIEADGERIFSLQPLLPGKEIGVLTGVAPGPELGRLKRAMVEAQIRGEIVTRGEAEGLVRSWSSRAPKASS